MTSGPRSGERIEVTHELVVGRQDADFTIDDAELSRRHAVVRCVPDGLEVEDLGSTNGTLVDGERIDQAVRLRVGARIGLGDTVIEVEEVTIEAGATTLAETRARALPRDVAQPTTVDPGVPQAQRLEPAATPAQRPAPPAAPPAQRVEPPAAPPFQPRVGRRRGGLASRSWVPVVLSFGTVVLTAIALVIYFASR